MDTQTSFSDIIEDSKKKPLYGDVYKSDKDTHIQLYADGGVQTLPTQQFLVNSHFFENCNFDVILLILISFIKFVYPRQIEDHQNRKSRTAWI